MKLIAAEILFHPNDENHCSTVRFEASDQRFIQVRRLLEPAEYDSQLGWGGGVVELSDQAEICFDGIRSVSLFPTLLRIELNADGQSTFQDTFIEINYNLPPERSLEMRQVLANVFHDFADYFDNVNALPSSTIQRWAIKIVGILLLVAITLFTTYFILTFREEAEANQIGETYDSIGSLHLWMIPAGLLAAISSTTAMVIYSLLRGRK